MTAKTCIRILKAGVAESSYGAAISVTKQIN
jgi:hypothetical protein